MPEPNDGVVDMPIEINGPKEGVVMAAAESSVDPSVHSAVMTVLSGEVTAAGQSRTRRFDQLSEDAASLWAIAMTSPTIYAAQSIRMLNGTPGNFANEVPAK